MLLVSLRKDWKNHDHVHLPYSCEVLPPEHPTTTSVNMSSLWKLVEVWNLGKDHGFLSIWLPLSSWEPKLDFFCKYKLSSIPVVGSLFVLYLKDAIFYYHLYIHLWVMLP